MSHENSKHTVEFRPHPFCQFAYKLGSPENVLVLWVELFSCLPDSSRGLGSLSDAPERSYLLRSNPGLWGQVLKNKRNTLEAPLLHDI